MFCDIIKIIINIKLTIITLFYYKNVQKIKFEWKKLNGPSELSNLDTARKKWQPDSL